MKKKVEFKFHFPKSLYGIYDTGDGVIYIFGDHGDEIEDELSHEVLHWAVQKTAGKKASLSLDNVPRELLSVDKKALIQKELPPYYSHKCLKTNKKTVLVDSSITSYFTPEHLSLNKKPTIKRKPKPTYPTLKNSNNLVQREISEFF